MDTDDTAKRTGRFGIEINLNTIMGGLILAGVIWICSSISDIKDAAAKYGEHFKAVDQRLDGHDTEFRTLWGYVANRHPVGYPGNQPASAEAAQ